MRLFDRHDDTGVVLGTSVPIGEVVLCENREASIGTTGYSGGIGVGHEGDC